MSAPERYGRLGQYVPLFIRLAGATQIGYEIALTEYTGFPVGVWRRPEARPTVLHDADALTAWIEANEHRWLNQDHTDD